MRRILSALLLLATLASCSESLSPEDFYSIWGAEGVRLTLSNTMARFETSCWAGDLAIPILIDDDQFTAIGNVNRQGGAGGAETRAVILKGRLNGDELRVTVETSFAMGPYTLQRNANVTIPGCP
jgi:putative VirB-like lipoprotein